MGGDFGVGWGKKKLYLNYKKTKKGTSQGGKNGAGAGYPPGLYSKRGGKQQHWLLVQTNKGLTNKGDGQPKRHNEEKKLIFFSLGALRVFIGMGGIPKKIGKFLSPHIKKKSVEFKFCFSYGSGDS